jgi:putative ABC transport system permease protein
MGGALGLALGFGGLKLLLAIDPPKVPRLGEISIDASVLVFTLLISILTAFIFGLAPALQASKPNLAETLKEGGKGAPASSLRRRARNAIVISEVALTQVLLISAALMLKSFISLQSVNPGLNPENVLTMQMMLPTMKYSKLNPETDSYDRDKNSIVDFYDDALRNIQNTPGVQAAGAITYLPLVGNAKNEREFNVEGRPQAPDEKFAAQIDQVSEDYFNAMSIARLEGRVFYESDNLDSTPVAIVNKTLAERFWGGASASDSAKNAIGKRIIIPGLADEQERDTLEIIGVVGDVKYSKLNDTSSFMHVYVPYRQLPEIYTALAVRTSLEPMSMASAVQQAIRQKDPDQPVYAVKTMQAVISESISEPRLYMVLLATFGTVALLIAAIGIYGVMSYSVTQRKQEIGVRMALGAQSADILKMVIRQGMTLALIGTAIGIAMALALGVVASKLWSGTLATLLFGVGPIDMTTYVLLPALLVAVALVSIFIPAKRATKVDPIVALRYE